MGVLNVTPDCFSDGGRYADLDAAVAHGVRMHAAGRARWSTSAASRPGPAPSGSTPRTESARVLPVIRELAAAGVPMSIDTTRAERRRGGARGRRRGGQRRLRRPRRPRHGPGGRRRRLPLGPHALARPLRAGWRELAAYDDVVKEVRAELRAAGRRGGGRRRARRTGSSSTPASASPSAPSTTGGSPPTCEQLIALGFPVLFGASRKSYLGALLADAGRHAAPGRRARGRDGRHQRARGRRRRVGGTGARRARHRRRARGLAGQRPTRGWRTGRCA